MGKIRGYKLVDNGGALLYDLENKDGNFVLRNSSDGSVELVEDERRSSHSQKNMVRIEMPEEGGGGHQILSVQPGCTYGDLKKSAIEKCNRRYTDPGKLVTSDYFTYCTKLGKKLEDDTKYEHELHDKIKNIATIELRKLESEDILKSAAKGAMEIINFSKSDIESTLQSLQASDPHKMEDDDSKKASEKASDPHEMEDDDSKKASEKDIDPHKMEDDDSKKASEKVCDPHKMEDNDSKKASQKREKNIQEEKPQEDKPKDGTSIVSVLEDVKKDVKKLEDI